MGKRKSAWSIPEDTGIGKPSGNWLVVSSGMLHADFRFPIKAVDLLDQVIDRRLCVGDVAGRHQDYIAWPADGDSTLTFGNINTNSVHNRYSFVM